MTIAPWTARSSARAASRSAPGARRAEELGHAMHAAGHHRRVQMVRAGHDVGDDLGFRRDRGPRARGRRRSSRSGRQAARSCRSPTGRSAASWSRSGSVSTAAPAACGPSSVGSSSRPRTGRSPITSKYDPPTTPARTTRGSPRPIIVNGIVEKSPKARQRGDAAAQVLDLRDREVGVLDADAARALADVDQAIFIAVDERPQQHAADDAEDRGVGADPERQGDDHRDRHALDPGQRAQRKPEVGHQAAHDRAPAGAGHGPPRRSRRCYFLRFWRPCFFSSRCNCRR